MEDFINAIGKMIYKIAFPPAIAFCISLTLLGITMPETNLNEKTSISLGIAMIVMVISITFPFINQLLFSKND